MSSNLTSLCAMGRILFVEDMNPILFIEDEPEPDSDDEVEGLNLNVYEKIQLIKYKGKSK